MHAFFDRHMDRMCLISVESFPVLKQCNKRQIIGPLAVKYVRAGFEFKHSFYPALHPLEIPDELRYLVLKLILYPEHYYVSDHFSPPFSHPVH